MQEEVTPSPKDKSLPASSPNHVESNKFNNNQSNKSNNNNNNNDEPSSDSKTVVRGLAWRLRCCSNSKCTLRANYLPCDTSCFINRDANGSCNIRAIARYAAWNKQWPDLEPVKKQNKS